MKGVWFECGLSQFMKLCDVMNKKMVVHSCEAHSWHVKAQHDISLMSCISNIIDGITDGLLEYVFMMWM